MFQNQMQDFPGETLVETEIAIGIPGNPQVISTSLELE
jgi:hypothetical protein